MNIKRAKDEIKHSISAYLQKDEFGDYRIPSIRQRPILLMGPPGIGKTQIMEQIAGECDLALVSYTITHHTRQSAIGLPFIREKEYGGKTYSVTEYTMSEIIAAVYDKMEASGKTEGLLFIDEINCVSETLAPTMLQFLQCKSFGNQKVPEGWIIVAAGNPPEYNKSVRDFDIVTLDRVKVINVEADFEIWKEYAYRTGVHGSIISYLDIRKENFYRMEQSVDGKQFVTARGWQDLSELIRSYEELGLEMDQEVMIQYLQHPKVAKDFAHYLELYYKYRTDYRIDEILQGTIRPGTLNKLKFAAFDERLEVVGLLLSRLAENFRRQAEQDAQTAKLFELVKSFRHRMEMTEYEKELPSRILIDLTGKEQRDMQRRAEAGQNEKELRQQNRNVFRDLETWAALLEGLEQHLLEDEGNRMNHAELREQSLELVRRQFSARSDELERNADAVSEQLEFAFDFMEAAFGEGPEMVVFITELSVNRDAMWFLMEHESPRYYMYNRNFQFDRQSKEIRRELDSLRDDMLV